MNNQLYKIRFVSDKEGAATFSSFLLDSITYCLKLSSEIMKSSNRIVLLTAQVFNNYALMNEVTVKRYNGLIAKSAEDFSKVAYVR